jgi:hypothetical protein
VGRVELAGQAVHVVGEHVAVQIQRHLDTRMTELRLDDLWVGTLGDQKGRTGVSEVVDAQVARASPARARLAARRVAGSWSSSGALPPDR